VTTGREDWLHSVGEALHGPRRNRRRLLAELEGHLEDAAAEERGAGHAPAEAEAAALRRLGAPAGVAAAWNADVRARRTSARLRVVAVAVLVGALAAPVALAQRSDHSPPRPVKPPQAKLRPERGGAPGRAS
jgi:hypothetical protein